MGFKIHKSVKIGLLRFELASAGIDVSAGIKGLRFRRPAYGNRVQVGPGGTDYRATLASGRSGPSPSAADGLGMERRSAADLLAEIDGKYRRWRTLPWVWALFTLATLALASTKQVGMTGQIVWVSFVGAVMVGSALAARHDTRAKTAVVLFDLDEDVERRYRALHEAFDAVAACQGLWYVEAGAEAGGANGQGPGRRRAIRISEAPPFEVRTNLDVPSLPLGRETAYFFPDRLLVFSPSGVSGVDYRDVNIDVAPERFSEAGRVPKDAKVIGQTWTHVDKDGRPDTAFKSNPRVPVVLYDRMTLHTPSGLRAVVQLSRVGVGARLQAAVRAMAGG